MINFHSETAPKYLKLLRQRADSIEDATHERVDVKIKTQRIDDITIWSLTLRPRGRPASVYELMQVRLWSESVSAVIEAYHLNDSLRLTKADSEKSFREGLAKIFDHPRTQEIVRLLADEAAENEVPNRTFLVAEQLFQHAKGDFAHVSIQGIGGFLSADTLRKLAKEPGEKGSAYEVGNGCFVAGFQFEGEVKMTLSREELEELKRAARKALDSKKSI